MGANAGKNGIFITFEGIEGSGKSTQSKLFFEYLKEAKIPAVLTLEPGGTELGKSIRKMLLDSESVSAQTELLLFLADRSEHVNKMIKPALAEGTCVICDRFSHSTFAYQAGGRKLDPAAIRLLNKFATGGLEPDITFFIDIPVEIGFNRKKQENLKLDRIEQEGIDFHHTLRNAYLELLKTEKMMVRIDGTKYREAIQEDIINIFNQKFVNV
jgi:dTMP kinase